MIKIESTLHLQHQAVRHNLTIEELVQKILSKISGADIQALLEQKD